MCIFTSEPRSRHDHHDRRSSRVLDRNWNDPPRHRSYYEAGDTRVATLPEGSFRRRSRDSREYEDVIVRDPPARHYGREVVVLDSRRSSERAGRYSEPAAVSRYEYRSESSRRG